MREGGAVGRERRRVLCMPVSAMLILVLTVGLEINSENSVNFNEGSVITGMWEENQLCVCTLCNPEVLRGGLHVFC